VLGYRNLGFIGPAREASRKTVCWGSHVHEGVGIPKGRTGHSECLQAEDKTCARNNILFSRC